MNTEGIDVDEAIAPRRRAGRLHHAHAGAGGPRSVLAGARSKSISGRCATRSGCRHDDLMALGRVDPPRSRRDVLHDGAGAEGRAGAPTRCRRCTARSRARCGCRSIPGRARSSVPIGHITNGVHVPHAGWRRRCTRSTTGTSAPTGRRAAREPDLWEAIDERRRWRAVGDASDAEGAADRLRAPARRRAGRTARRAGRRSSRSSAARSASTR